MFNIPEGETDSDPRWQKGYDDGFNERKPSSENSVYASGWCHGHNASNQCSSGASENAFIDSLYAGGL